ncbi:hypothetical protein D3C73_759450 [compost metagenome]
MGFLDVVGAIFVLLSVGKALGLGSIVGTVMVVLFAEDGEGMMEGSGLEEADEVGSVLGLAVLIGFTLVRVPCWRIDFSQCWLPKINTRMKMMNRITTLQR